MTSSFTVIRDDTPQSAIPRGTVVALGNFDGVHLGHRAVIAAALDMARKAGRPALAVTFEPHPRTFYSPNTPQFKLTSLDDKLRLLAATGLAGAVVMTFDAARARTTAMDFINHDLLGRLGITGVSVGYDFHFGKGRAGSPALLAEKGKELGFGVHIQPHVDADGMSVSSTEIRNALGQGLIGEATALLGYPWFVSGEVVHGEPRAPMARASTASPVSAAARPSTTAPRCSKCSCSTSRAISMASGSTSPSSPSSATN
jgi:riboflavin kinase/FMN adenylyltransferase